MLSLLYSILACHMLIQLITPSLVGRQEASFADYRGSHFFSVSCTEDCRIMMTLLDLLFVVCC